MKASHADLFRDPATASRLRLQATETEGEEVLEGFLESPDGLRFAIRRGVPRFVGEEHYADNFGHQWNTHPQVQHDAVEGTGITRRRLFRTSLWSEQLPGERVLEVGCGSGRFTRELATTGADVYSFDLSDAVDANRANNGAQENVCIFQGDVQALPFEPGTFDKVICLGVLQHTPDVPAAFAAMARMVRPGGELVVDCYIRRLRAMVHWKYLLRPLTVRMRPETLYRIVAWYVPRILPLARWVRRVGGPVPLRLLPIMLPTRIEVPREAEGEWALLSTYDALSAVYDQPQTPAALERLFLDNGLEDVRVEVDTPGTFALIGAGRAASGAVTTPPSRALP